VDVDPGTFNINPARVEEALEGGRYPRVRALLPVHFAGQPCDMNRLCAIARQYRLRIVEDAAHAAGAARQLDGRGMTRVGTIGDATCFSFYATKNFTAAEGGMITTGDDALAEKAAIASLHGMDRDAWKRYHRSGSWRYEVRDLGFKYNLSDVHAAIGLAQLRRADEFMRQRAATAAAYSAAFRAEEALQTPYAERAVEHAWHLYVLRIKPEQLRIGRDQLVELLRERGVGTSVHCIPLHTMEFYQRRYGYRAGDFPVAEDVFSRCLSLPIYPSMTDEDVTYVIDTVLALVRENRR
jgi:dTDP-4-amino-4,6-dideoxygalactose transaminase